MVALGKPEVASSTPGGSNLPVMGVNSGQIPLTELARPRPLHTRYTLSEIIISKKVFVPPNVDSMATALLYLEAGLKIP